MGKLENLNNICDNLFDGVYAFKNGTVIDTGIDVSLYNSITVNVNYHTASDYRVIPHHFKVSYLKDNVGLCILMWDNSYEAVEVRLSNNIVELRGKNTNSSSTLYVLSIFGYR